MQVIEAEEGRALSSNGIVWEILVRATQGNTLGRLGGDNKKTYYRFGMWSMDDGLMKRSNSPVSDEDYFELAAKCDKLIEFQSDALRELRKAVAEKYQFRVTGHRLIISGICDECSKIKRLKRPLDLI